MPIATYLDRLHAQVRANRWFGYFATFNRLALAAGFFPAGMVKIMGERFTNLTTGHPMGHYLYALYRTGYYYTFVGVLQVLAALLLLWPRTATLGAVIYFPIILNICILSFSVRFEGSLISAPLMVLANLYLVCWDYHKFKFLLPFYPTPTLLHPPIVVERQQRFPWRFFAGVFVTVVSIGVLVSYGYRIQPRINQPDCLEQCPDSANPAACAAFCDCIHQRGGSLHNCLEEFRQASQAKYHRD